jgi:GT2 family glycosyltransferase/glycosyltransferase involved in cell wall biosynthesis
MASRLTSFDPTKAIGKQEWDEAGKRDLAILLASNRQIEFPAEPVPRISIIIVLHNKAHLSLLCLDALQFAVDVPFELVIVDNASTDSTSELLDRCANATIVRNAHNLGFGEACMQGVERSRGEFLFFLNNDAFLRPGSVEAALRNFRQNGVGAVGGKILLADGKLQEAGSIIWSDGSALGYGRGDDPAAGQYCFRRPVDYCSGAFLFTPKALFVELGGFDKIYSPAYYEDTDYCTRLWQAGYRVIYEPQAIIHHYESASSGGNDAAQPRMAEKQRTFIARWQEVLKSHSLRSQKAILRARIASRAKGLRVLYIDDCIPHRSQGSGYPRSNDILRALANQGHFVTAVPFFFRFASADEEYRDVARNIELYDYRIRPGDDDDSVPFFDHRRENRDRFQQYVEMADLIWISRPHNLTRFLDDLVARGQTHAKLVFDAEAVFTDREKLSIDIGRRVVAPNILGARRRGEFVLAEAADAVTVVSARDWSMFHAAGIQNLHLLGHCLEARPTMMPFEERTSFLFVGAVRSPETPNGDSMRYFCAEIWPQVRCETGAQLIIAGTGTDYYLNDLACEGIQVIGAVVDLTPLYESARVVIIPTRYAGGIPYKAHEAASFGVPMVVSQLIADQLQWGDGIDLLVAKDPASFAGHCARLYTDEELWRQLRTNSLTRILCEFSRESFENKVAEVLCSVTASAGAPTKKLVIGRVKQKVKSD